MVAASSNTNGATSWAPANTGLADLRVRVLAIDPDACYPYAGTEGGVFKSTNGGASWTAKNNGLGSLTLRALAIDPDDPGTLYAGTGGLGVFKSVDGGDALAGGQRRPDER